MSRSKQVAILTVVIVMIGCTRSFRPGYELTPSPGETQFEEEAVLLISDRFQAQEEVGNSNVWEIRYAFGEGAADGVADVVESLFSQVEVRRGVGQAEIAQTLSRTENVSARWVIVPEIQTLSSNSGIGFNVEVELRVEVMDTRDGTSVTAVGEGRGTSRFLVAASLEPTAEEALSEALNALRLDLRRIMARKV